MPVKLKRYQKDFDYSYTFGVFPTLELLQHAPGQVIQVLLHSRGEQNSGVHKIRSLCGELGIRVEENDKAVERLTGRGNDYAVGVFWKAQGTLNPEADHVALVHPGSTGNLGTILRTMLGFGLTDLAIIRPAADRFHPQAVRASMGAIFQVTGADFDDFDSYRSAYGRRAFYPFMTNGQARLDQVMFSLPFTLVFGSESAGLPDTYLAIGTSVIIPQEPRIDSLNLAVAVGIALYESRRGR